VERISREIGRTPGFWFTKEGHFTEEEEIWGYGGVGGGLLRTKTEKKAKEGRWLTKKALTQF